MSPPSQTNVPPLTNTSTRLLKDYTVRADYVSGGGDGTWPKQIKIAYMALSSANDDTHIRT